MAIAIVPITSADDTFSASGAANWNAGMKFTGLGTNQLLYSTGATALAQSANATYDGVSMTLSAGTITTAISLLSLTETRNNAAIIFPGLTYYAQSTAESGSTKLLTLNAGTTASNGNVGGLLFSAAGGSPQIDFLTNNGSRGNLLGSAGGGYDININAGSLNGNINLIPTGSGGVTLTKYQEFIEMTAPAGAANSARLFTQDNGAGKTQLMVIFGSGAAQQVAIEL